MTLQWVCVCVCMLYFQPGSQLNFKLHNFLRWSLEGSAGCQSQSDVIMFNMEWLYKKSHTVNYSRVQLWALYSLTLQLGNIFSRCLFTAEIRTLMLLEKKRREAESVYYSFSAPVNLGTREHMFPWRSMMTHKTVFPPWSLAGCCLLLTHHK